MQSLKDKVVVITGGSKGFGLACAQVLKNQGAKLSLLARSEAGLQEAKKILGDDVLTFSLDIANSKQIDEAFKTTCIHFGHIDHLVNNAGLAQIGSSDELSDEALALQINTNLVGSIASCRSIIPYLRETASQGNNCRIINVSSASAYHFDEMAHMSIYAATKAALERYSRDLRKELEVDNIGVSIVRPGSAMDTDFANKLNFDKLSPALHAWQNQGPYCYDGMTAGHVAEAINFCLAMPRGVSVDLLEIRPNHRTKKPIF